MQESRFPSGVPCPKCGHPWTKVYDTRSGTYYGHDSTWRRRICKKCVERFTTHEIHIDALDGMRDWTEVVYGKGD